MSVVAIYKIRAADGRAEELLAMLRQGRDFTISREGSEGFEIFQGDDDPHRFVMLERWASVEAHMAHFEANVKGTGVLETVEALTTEPFPPPQESHFVPR